VRDEFAGWFKGFDRYRRGDSEIQTWLEMYNMSRVRKDRVGGSISVDRPAVSITGGIQPGALQNALCEIHFASGFAARIQFVMPPSEPQSWTDADVSMDVEDDYRRLLDDLSEDSVLFDEDRGLLPELELTASAKKDHWIPFYNANRRRAHSMPAGAAKAVVSKLPGLALRVAIPIHVTRFMTGETDSIHIDDESMRNAICIARWFCNENLRVYNELKFDERALSAAQRFLQDLPNEFSTQRAVDAGAERGYSRSKVEKMLQELLDVDIERVRKGIYRKLYVGYGMDGFNSTAVE